MEGLNVKKIDIKLILVFLPVILLLLLLFIFPLTDSFTRSVHNYEGEYIGFDAYKAVFSDPNFISSLTYTVLMAGIATILSIIVAIIISMALRGTFVGKKLALFMYQMNVSMPHMSVAVMMVFLLGATGFMSILAYNLGFIDSYTEFPHIVQTTSPLGAIISFTWKFAPFISLSVLTILQTTVIDYEEQAATLGVGPMRRFRHIILPSMAPAIIASSIICFAYAFGSYEVPAILGRTETLAMRAYEIFNMPYGREIIAQSYVLCNIITVVTVSLAIAYFYFSVPKARRRR